MDHQKLILDKLTGILAVTDNKSAQLLDLVEKAGRTFIGGAGRSLLVSRFFAMRQRLQPSTTWTRFWTVCIVSSFKKFLSVMLEAKWMFRLLYSLQSSADSLSALVIMQ